MIAEAILLGSVAAVGAGLAAANRLFSVRRVFERHNPQAIADAKEGSVIRICGIVRPGGGDLLYAPLSGRPCVAWTLHVSRQYGRGEGANFARVLDERIIRPFFVDDDQDTAFITPKSTRLSLIEDVLFESRVEEAPPGLIAYLAERDVDFGSANYVVREGILSPGEPVTVIGKGYWQSDPSRRGEGYRSVGQRLVIETGPRGAVHVSDDPKLARVGR